MMQEADVDEFETEPDTFIKNDLEESDQESRRRNCMTLVNEMCKKYPQESNKVLSEVLQLFMGEYTANRES